MTIWLDNHLSPALARWIASEFSESCLQVRDVGLERTSDRDIFMAARASAQVFITKDKDFADLVIRLGPPPGIVLLSVGNTSTAHMRDVLRHQLGEALRLIQAGERLVEIAGST